MRLTDVVFFVHAEIGHFARSAFTACERNTRYQHLNGPSIFFNASITTFFTRVRSRVYGCPLNLNDLLYIGYNAISPKAKSKAGAEYTAAAVSSHSEINGWSFKINSELTGPVVSPFSIMVFCHIDTSEVAKATL